MIGSASRARRAVVACALVTAACGAAAETIERTLRVGVRERSYEHGADVVAAHGNSACRAQGIDGDLP